MSAPGRPQALTSQRDQREGHSRAGTHPMPVEARKPSTATTADGCWALIALKAPGRGKQRLADVLDARQRQSLIERMAGQVLAALRGCPAIAGIAVTSPLPMVGDVLWIPDAHGELNAALTGAANQLSTRGVTELLVLHADLPWLGSDDIGALLAAGRDRGLALAGDRHGRGTNALFTRLPMPIALAFGPDSLARHLAQAGALGLPAVCVERPGWAFDVDEPDDLWQLGLPQAGLWPTPAVHHNHAAAAPPAGADLSTSDPRSLTWHPTPWPRPATPI